MLFNIVKKLNKKSIELQNEILEENQEALTKLASKKAEINANAVTTTAKAVKKGFAGDENVSEKIFCKHCGEKIDSDSVFCKHCGNKVI